MSNPTFLFLKALLMSFIDRFLNRREETVTPYAKAPPPVETVTEIVRLRPDVLAALERELNSSPYVGPGTTDLQVAFQLGQQAVLKKLRDGYAVP
jgi:hypothetical protein